MASFLQHSHQQIHPVVISSGCCSSGHSKICPGHKGLYLYHHGPGAFNGAGRHSSRSAGRAPFQHKFRGIFDLCQSLLPHFKDADLVGRAETVLHSPENPVGGVAVSLKIQHRIYHMLQDSGACHNPLFCHMAYNKDCDSKPLGNLKKRVRTLSHLAYASRSRGNILHKHGLDGVDDHCIGRRPLHYRLDHLQICLA